MSLLLVSRGGLSARLIPLLDNNPKKMHGVNLFTKSPLRFAIVLALKQKAHFNSSKLFCLHAAQHGD